jgi:hypothetical protein
MALAELLRNGFLWLETTNKAPGCRSSFRM